MTTLRAALPALLLAAVALLPSSGKAFTIDDTLFLDQAEHALHDPAHPSAFDVVWTDRTRRLSSVMPSGPVMAWLLTPAVAHGADCEEAAHAIVFALFGIGILATVRLARRLGCSEREAAVAGMALVASPAVLGMAATVMPDVPAMTLGVLGVERAVAWRDERRLHQAVATTLALSAAMLARMHLVALVPATALLILDGDPLSLLAWRGAWRRLVPLALVPVVALAVMVATRDPGRQGASAIGAAQSFLTWRSLDRNSVSFGLHWLLVLPIGIPWLVLRRRSLRWRLLVGIVPALAVLLVVAETPRALWLAPLAGLGYLVLIDAHEHALRRRSSIQLGLALWLLAAAPVAFYLNLAAKYVAASAPAAAILLVLLARESSQGEWSAATKRLVAATLAAGFALGILVVRADARFAEVGRRAAIDLVVPHVARGEHVWFLGHWGFQWYAEHAGARAWSRESATLQPGEVLITADVAGVNPGDLPSRVPSKRSIGVVTDEAPGGRIMIPSSRAGFFNPGFFSNGFGYLPWSWGGDPVERIEAWRIE